MNCRGRLRRSQFRMAATLNLYACHVGLRIPHVRSRISRVLVELLRECCLVYLDDIIIYSRSYEEHLLHLALVLERLQEYQLKVALSKCKFGMDNLKYLGHMIALDMTTPLDEHIIQICDAIEPRNRKDLRSFLGLCNWLRD